MAPKLNLNSVEKTLLRLNVSIFSIREFSKIFNVNLSAVKSFLSRHSRKKDSPIIKIARGLYATSFNPPTKFEVANRLYRPSYISFETALSYYNIIPEIVYTVTSTTTKRTKEIKTKNLIFKYYQIKKKLFFGYQPKKIREKIILIADKEKALLDYIYLLSFKKQPFNERMNLRKIDKNKLGYYVKYFKNNIRKNKAFINLTKKIFKRYDYTTIHL